jgi:hypothetical protein
MDFSLSSLTPKDIRPPVSPTKKLMSATLKDRQNKKPIIYIEFEDASIYASDPFWRDVLLLAARGEFNAKRIYYDEDCLIKKDSGVRQEMPSDPKKLAEAFIKFHRKHDDLLSPQDLAAQEKRRKNSAQEEVTIQWTTCAKKMKRALLLRYADMMTRTRGQDYHHYNNLVCVLLLAASKGMLTEYMVKIRNNNIVRVRCVDYDDETCEWYLDTEVTPIKTKPNSTKKSSKKLEIEDGWEQIVERHKDMIEKSIAKTTKKKRIVESHT